MIQISFDWKEFYHVARYLCNNIEDKDIGFSQEAVRRCSVSRVYYAAYHYAKDYAIRNLNYHPLSRRETRAKCYNEHREIIEHYRSRHRDEIASRLEELRDWRNDCDYHEDAAIALYSYKIAMQHSATIIHDMGGEIYH